MDPTIQIISAVLGALVVFGAFAAWLVLHMDRRFDEARADTNRRFDEAKDYMNRRFDEAKADMDQRFGEAKADMNRRFGEAKADTDRCFDETGQRFDEAGADTQRRFDEAAADTRQGFERMREDHLRLERKLDAQASQIADLRQDVGRLQGIVERTYQPSRFTVPPAREARVGEGVRDAPASYDTGAGDDVPEREDAP